MDRRFVIAASVLLYFISAYFSYDFFSAIAAPSGKSATSQESGDVAIKDAEQEEEVFTGPKTEECPLNGEKLTKEHKELWEKRRPLGVMIENHVDSRPQSGLTSASVVHEFIAEGGITRFLAVFYCKDASYVGPVRSARVYFIEMLRGYGAYPLYAHVGGANTPGKADALGMISKLGWGKYNDLNQFSVRFPVFYRDHQRLPNVALEHTVYSSTAKLWEFAAENRDLTEKNEDGDKWDEDYEKWEFQDGEASKGTVTAISYEFKGADQYAVTWKYDAATNSYKRFHNGTKPHIDNNNNKQISPKNVAVAFMKDSFANDGYDGGHHLYGTTGTGKAIVFQNGEAIEGTWKKPDVESQITFYDTSGDEIEFVRGQIWISSVSTGKTVDY